jgi:hypothetical protein
MAIPNRREKGPDRINPVDRRSRYDLLLAALAACEEMSAVAAIIAEADDVAIGTPKIQSASRMIARTATAAEHIICELIEVDEDRRWKQRKALASTAGRRNRKPGAK